jgi:DnaK suppressor protein
MNVNHYKQLLLGEERRLLAKVDRERANVRDASDGTPHDSGDDSATDALKAEQLTQAESARDVLEQVRDALARIETGTYGRCAEDGEPMDEARLEAVPWAAYCLKHDRRRGGTGERPLTL